MNWKAFAVVALALAVLGSGFVFPARAAPPPPYNLYGIATSDGVTPLGMGTRITAFIDGVDYSNASSVYTSAGNYDVDVFGDWVTAPGQPNTPERKEGGSLGDETMFVAGDMTLTGQVFTTKKFWTPNDYVLETIQLAPQQPNLLKICKLVPYPNDTWPPYAYIFNPGAAVPGSQYYLQKDLLLSYAGPIFTLSGTINPGYTYVNMTSYSFAPGGDNLRLAWDNLGGTGFGGSDIIVDRVEFNATAGGTLYWEPGNTDMTDAPGPGPGQGITRDAACGDTNSNAVDFTVGPVPRPGVDPVPTVTLTTPNGGQDWTGGTVHNIVWDMNDNQLTDLDYIIGLSVDSGGSFSIFVISGSAPEGNGIPYPWTVNTVDTTQARIQVCVIDDNLGGACDASDADFTIDSTRPTILGTNPASGAAAVDTSSNYIITFSEPMNRPVTEGAVSFSPLLAGGQTYSWTALPEELTVNPNNAMQISTTYTVTVSCAAEDDSDTGNALASCPRSFTFTTAAGTPPPVVDLTAPNGGEVWSGNTVHDIAWTMSDDGPGNLQVWLNYSINSGATYPSAIASISRAQGPNTYQWTTPCINSTTVRVQMTASDGTGTSSDASSGDFAIDCSRPTVTNVAPASGATEVALPTPVVITFSERMETLVTQNAVTINPGVSGIGFAWSVGDTVLTITHNDFSMCTSYTLGVGTTAEDVSLPGNTLSPAYSWSFSTICGPTVAISAPAGGEVWSGLSSHNVVATMTDADAQVRVTVQINTDGGATWTTLDGPTFRNTGSAQTISVPIPAVDTTIARIRVIAQDQSGINGSAVSQPFTIDATAPSVSSSVPANAATNVGLTDVFTITFSEEMDPTTAEAAISLTPAAGTLSFAWNLPAHTVATVTHSAALALGDSYTLAVQVSALDVSDPGNALAPPYSATFDATDVSPVQADVGGPYGGQVGQTIAFDGTGSTGPITEYDWEFVSPDNVTYLESGETTSRSFNQAGTWTVVLTVTDANGNSDTDETTFVITAAPPQDFLSAYWWVFVILILAVVFAILFLLLGRRRKKEEEMPEAVPAAQVVTMPPAAPARAPPKAPPPKAAPPRPAAPAKGSPTTRDCPSCGTIVDQTDTECFMCGAKL